MIQRVSILDEDNIYIENLCRRFEPVMLRMVGSKSVCLRCRETVVVVNVAELRGALDRLDP